MIDVQLAALILITFRFIAVGFMLRVLSIQFPLLKAENDSQVKNLRFVLFYFAIAVTMGNFVPILIDIYGLVAEEVRGDTLETSLTIYFFSNAASAVVSAVFFWLIYKVTEESTLRLEEKNQELRKENTELRKKHRK